MAAFEARAGPEHDPFEITPSLHRGTSADHAMGSDAGTGTDLCPGTDPGPGVNLSSFAELRARINPVERHRCVRKGDLSIQEGAHPP